MRRVALPCAILAALGTAAGARAQTPPPPRPNFTTLPSAYDAMLAAQQEQAARQAVIQQNEISRLDAQLRTQQNLATLQAMGNTPIIPPPPAAGPMRSIDVSGLASIPDSALADSNAKVKAAADNRP